MKRIKDLIIGEKFWTPDRGIVTKIENDKFEALDGVYGKDSLLNTRGQFLYFSQEWWELNKKFFDYSTFHIGETIFTISGIFEKISEIVTNNGNIELYNDNKMFEYISKNTSNYTWFKNIQNIKGCHKINLHQFLNICFDNVPQQYIQNHPDISELANKLANSKSTKHYRMLIGDKNDKHCLD